MRVERTSPRSPWIVENDTVALQCVTRGNPSPRVEWIRSGSILSREETLVLKFIKKRDRSYYFCVATNDVGRMASESLFLDVKCNNNCTQFNEIELIHCIFQFLQ